MSCFYTLTLYTFMTGNIPYASLINTQFLHGPFFRQLPYLHVFGIV